MLIHQMKDILQCESATWSPTMLRLFDQEKRQTGGQDIGIQFN